MNEPVRKVAARGHDLATPGEPTCEAAAPDRPSTPSVSSGIADESAAEPGRGPASQELPGELDLLYSEVEEDLRASVRALLTARCDSAGVTALYDGDRSVLDGLWQGIAVELGLAGLLVPEDRGGAGGSAREAAVVLEELGRAAAPVPFLTSSVIATSVLLQAGSPALLADLAGGRQTATLVVPWSTPPQTFAEPLGGDGAASAPQTVGDPVPGAGMRAVDGRLTGTVTSVAGALEADILLVPVHAPSGTALYAVRAADATVTAVVSLDMSRQLADVTLDGAAATMVSDSADRAIGDGLTAGAALLASEQVGVARWCLETTLGYLKERRQFGRVLGGFQALKHRLADLYADIESGTAAARYAAAALAAGSPDIPVAAAVAQAFCSDLAVRVAEEVLQLHGGIGMTWEYPIHLYLKRAKASQLALGLPSSHRARLAGLIDLPA